MNSLIKIDDIVVNVNEIQAVTYYDTGETIWYPSQGYSEHIYEYQLSLKGKNKPVTITKKIYENLLKILDKEVN